MSECQEARWDRSGTTPSAHRLTRCPAYANIGMYQAMKNLTWLADSRSYMKSFPAGAVMEIAAYDASATHAFQKKSKAGIATPKLEMELIRQRLKQLRSEVKNAEKRGP